MRFTWFERELKSLMPNGDLRLVRDPRRLGMDLWAVERKLPPREHASALEEIRLGGLQRYHPIEVPGIGKVQYDIAPEWAVVHICRSEHCKTNHSNPRFTNHDAECYREPDQRDITVLHNWLYQFKGFEDSARSLLNEGKTFEQRKDAQFSDFMKKELKSSHEFRQLVFSDAPQKIFIEEEETSPA